MPNMLCANGEDKRLLTGELACMFIAAYMDMLIAADSFQYVCTLPVYR
jgi:hypothetical protein